MESDKAPSISLSYIVTMLESIKASMARLEGVEFDTDETQESLSANIYKEMT